MEPLVQAPICSRHGADTFDFADAVGAATIDLGAGADSLVFSGAVAGATIGGTDTAGDVALLTGTNTAVFSAVGTGAQGELLWLAPPTWPPSVEPLVQDSIYGGTGQTTLDFDGAVGAATIDLEVRG